MEESTYLRDEEFSN